MIIPDVFVSQSGTVNIHMVQIFVPPVTLIIPQPETITPLTCVIRSKQSANNLCFSPSCVDTHQLLAVGSLYKVDPDRVVCKRIVLSGHPFKINKRSAVIRYLFFNRGMPSATLAEM